MDFVVTLIADPTQGGLAPTFADSMALAFSAQGKVTPDWLADNVACDIPVQAANREEVEARVQQMIGDLPYDAVVQTPQGRRKKLLICDMDSTMITIECIDELADFVGKKAEVSLITERAMNGELDFPSALRERVALLKGLPESVLQQCYDERVKMMPGARQLVTTMRSHGAYSVLVSGGFTFFTSRVRQALGLDEDHSNRLESDKGHLTGNVILPILGKEAKLETLENTCAIRNIQPDEVLAVGDGANDLPMLLAAGMGVAYHAKPVVRAQAKARISHCDLTAMLYLQGYRQSEILA